MIIIIIILLFTIFMYYFTLSNSDNIIEKYHMISNNKYPNMKYIHDNRKIIIEELQNILHKKVWTNWINYDNINNIPTLNKTSRNDIIAYMNANICSLNSTSSWKIFCLLLYGEPILENVKYFPKTIKLFQNMPEIINVGLSCLEPHSETTLHKAYNNKICRCHIPLIIPKGNKNKLGLKVNNDILDWNDYFIFDDTFYHKAWNYTDEHRIVLLIDLKK